MRHCGQAGGARLCFLLSEQCLGWGWGWLEQGRVEESPGMSAESSRRKAWELSWSGGLGRSPWPCSVVGSWGGSAVEAPRSPGNTAPEARAGGSAAADQQHWLLPGWIQQPSCQQGTVVLWRKSLQGSPGFWGHFTDPSPPAARVSKGDVAEHSYGACPESGGTCVADTMLACQPASPVPQFPH